MQKAKQQPARQSQHPDRPPVRTAQMDESEYIFRPGRGRAYSESEVRILRSIETHGIGLDNLKKIVTAYHIHPLTIERLAEINVAIPDMIDLLKHFDNLKVAHLK
jgi:hypothetical protein